MILLVEDNQELRQAARVALEQAGFSVLEAGNGATALELAARQPIDILITDLRLPGLDGDELARHLWQRQPQLPVLIMTSHVEDPAARLAGRAVVWLSKPFALEALIDQARRLQENAWETSGPASTPSWVPATVARPTSRPTWTWWSALAALVLLVAGSTLLAPSAPDLPARTHGAGERGAHIEGLLPQGPIAALPEALIWQPLAGARRYRVTIQGIDRRNLLERTSETASLALPVELETMLRPNAAYHWTVEAEDDAARRLGSSTAHFRIVKAATPPTEALP